MRVDEMYVVEKEIDNKQWQVVGSHTSYGEAIDLATTILSVDGELSRIVKNGKVIVLVEQTPNGKR